MNEELITKFLENVGVSNETIALLKDPEEGLKVEDLAKEFKSAQREVYSNDPEVISELEKKAKGKERGSVERKLKKVFNISAEDWAAAELDGNYEKAIEFVREKLKKEGSKSAQDINTELQDANKKIKWYIEDEIPRIQKVEKLKVDNFHVDRHLRELIVENGELADNIGSDVAEIVLKEELRKKGFTTGLTEDEKLAILTKDGLSPQDEGKTRNLTISEVIKGIMTAKKLYKQSNADPDAPPKKKALPISEPVKSTLPGMAKAEQNLEELKLMRTSGTVFEVGK